MTGPPEQAALLLRSIALRMGVAFMGLAMTVPAIAAPPSFVGSVIPPRPSDCSAAAGAVLGGPDQSSHLAYEHWKCGDREIVLLLRFIERREGKAHSLVVEPSRAAYCTLPTADGYFDVFAGDGRHRGCDRRGYAE